jgi:hypothetical protein
MFILSDALEIPLLLGFCGVCVWLDGLLVTSFTCLAKLLFCPDSREFLRVVRVCCVINCFSYPSSLLLVFWSPEVRVSLGFYCVLGL